jgi:hypothetical protein
VLREFTVVKSALEFKASVKPLILFLSICSTLNFPVLSTASSFISTEVINKLSINLLYKSSVKLFSDKPGNIEAFSFNQASKPLILSIPIDYKDNVFESS